MATLNLNKKKFLSEENVAQIVKIGINFGERLNSIESETIADYDNTKTYLKGESCYHNNYIYRCKATATGDWDFSRWELIGDEITELTKDDIKDMLGLSDEELETLSKIILDSEVRLDKTYSSSKIYTDIQNAIDTAKAYTLTELGKISGASYKIASSTSDMTDEKVIYLLQNGLNYDMYIVDSGTPTKIGDTNIDLSGYLKIDDANNIYLKKTDATSTYATKIEINDKVDKTSIKTAISTTPSNDNVLSEKYIDENIVKKSDISTTIDDTSTDSQIPSAKAVYNATVDKNIKTYTDITQLGLTTPTTVEDIYNAIPANSCLNIFASLSSVTNLPLQQGLLSITKISTAGFDIIFKRSGSGSIANNAMYIGQLKGVDGTGLSWKKVCTTSVEDIPQTTITFTDTTNYKPESNHVDYGYRVLNGICYLQLCVRVVSVSSSPVIICNNLPKPLNGVRGTCASWTNIDSTSLCLKYGIYTEDLTLRVWDGTVGQAYLFRISYPVAES